MKPNISSLLIATAFAATSVSALAAAPDTSVGKAVFDRACTACHLPTGEGIPGVFPPVKQSDYVKKATPAQLVKILDNGLTGNVKVNGQVYNSAMPPQGLNEQDVAAVLNYISATLNAGKANFTADQVKRLRTGK